MLWAAQDARPGLDEIHVVHAYRPLSLTGCAWAPAVRASDARRSEARHVVAAAVTTIRAARPGINVDGSAIEGRPIDVLTDISELVDIVVIGGGQSRVAAASRVASDVPSRIVAQAVCPVVVVPCVDRDDELVVERGPVALLLSGGTLSGRAIEFALAFASRLEVGLVVAESCPMPLDSGAASAQELVARETSRQEELDAQLGGWRERYADVGVIVELRRETFLDTVDLLRRTARLLVLARQSDQSGSLDLFSGIALARTGCPVAVVPGACRVASRLGRSISELLSLDPVGAG
jgi:nucleotide-binding universal stress UspA family protein